LQQYISNPLNRNICCTLVRKGSAENSGRLAAIQNDNPGFTPSVVFSSSFSSPKSPNSSESFSSFSAAGLVSLALGGCPVTEDTIMKT